MRVYGLVISVLQGALAGLLLGVPFTGNVRVNVNMCRVCTHMRVFDTLVECVIKKS